MSSSNQEVLIQMDLNDEIIKMYFNSSNLSSNESDFKYINNEYLTRIEVVLLATLFVLTIIGNLTVILIILMYRSLSNNRSRWFKLNKNISRMSFYIIHLSIADFNVAFMSILPQLIWRSSVIFNHSHFLCKFVAFSQVFSVYASTFILIVMAYDRFKCICWPIKSCSWNYRNASLPIIMAWILAGLVASPQIFLFKIQPLFARDKLVETCSVKWASKRQETSYILYHLATQFVIPFLILTFLYSKIFFTVSKNIRYKNASIKFERESTKTLTELNLKNQINLDNSLNTLNGTLLDVKHDSENSIFKAKNNKNLSFVAWLRTNLRHKFFFTSSKKKSKNIKFTNNRSCNTVSNRQFEMKPIFKRNETLSETDKYSMKLDYKNSVYSKSFSKNYPIRQTFSGKALTKSKIKTLKLTLTVVLTYVFCSLPFYVCTFIHLMEDLSSKKPSNFFTQILVNTMILANLLYQLNSCANPFIYLFFNGNICKLITKFRSKM
ncbi:unnamed protein product [Brachionus calyciflorus]|uniref:G-protein coupled receptors family 1 profile domain-containing protein n=1 Tax=Brachionus calyciflorus TaxID=104777 RepID=A0A814KNV1_9BILA|nr:unnamed protein product [Brachionus calyciflorus]